MIKHKSSSKSSNNLTPLVKTSILGIGITNQTREYVLEYIVRFITRTYENMYIVTPNPEIIVAASKNDKLKKVLNQAQVSLPDGIGVKIAGYFFGENIKERITGINLMGELCFKVVNQPITVGFLGGGEGVAVKCAECLRSKYPGLKVVFAGASLKKNELTEKIGNSIDILFVAFGAPKQEFWMAENINHLPVRVMIGVGGAFDQIVNPSLRPPKFIDSIGFGWLYRLVRQPWRIKRQLALIEFIGMVIKEKLKKG